MDNQNPNMYTQNTTNNNVGMYNQNMNMTNSYNPYLKPRSVNNTFELIGLILNIIGIIMSLIGSILNIVFSASNSFSTSSGFEGSPIIALSIFGLIFSLIGFILAYVKRTRNYVTNKPTTVMLVVTILALLSIAIAIIPMLAVCSYNCALNNK